MNCSNFSDPVPPRPYNPGPRQLVARVPVIVR